MHLFYGNNDSKLHKAYDHDNRNSVVDQELENQLKCYNVIDIIVLVRVLVRVSKYLKVNTFSISHWGAFSFHSELVFEIIKCLERERL